MKLPYWLLEQLTEIGGHYNIRKKSDSTRVNHDEYKSLIGYNPGFIDEEYHCWGDHPVPNRMIDIHDAKGYLHYSPHKWVLNFLKNYVSGRCDTFIWMVLNFGKFSCIKYSYILGYYMINTPWELSNIKIIRTLLRIKSLYNMDDEYSIINGRVVAITDW